jgi:predicted membrane protein
MKFFTTILFTCAFVFSIQAQADYTKSLSGVEWVKIETKSGVRIKTHDKKELLIKVSGMKKRSEKAKGLKLVGAGGTDNTDVGFYVVQDGNTMLVKNLRRSEKAEIFLPKTQNVSVTNSWHGDIYIEGFSGEVEANANLNGGLQMKNLSGAVTAYSLNQGIQVTFNKVSQDAPIVIRTTNGEIDVTLPSSTAADLELSSWNGEIYTNFDLKRPNKDGLKSVSGKTIKGAINGGGVGIKLKSTNGTIYLRKE